ncbi:hypothetical protein D1007_47814 [Hordeum vulgare]|nr:hypothetical protein D1007_47814 [Hordeum vulgare]
MITQMDSFIAAGLTGADVVVAFIACWVVPLKAWVHRICDMGGHKDPCRLSTVVLPLHKVAARVNGITNFQLDEDTWQFGVVPYDRHTPAAKNTLDGPLPQVFRPDRSEPDAAEYESDSVGLVVPEHSGALMATGAHGGEGDEEEPAGDPTDEA